DCRAHLGVGLLDRACIHSALQVASHGLLLPISFHGGGRPRERDTRVSVLKPPARKPSLVTAIAGRGSSVTRGRELAGSDRPRTQSSKTHFAQPGHRELPHESRPWARSGMLIRMSWRGRKAEAPGLP